MKRTSALLASLLLATTGAALAATGSGTSGDDPQADGSGLYVVGFYEMPDDRRSYQGEPVVTADERLGFLVVDASDEGFERRAKQDDRVRYVQEDHRDYELAFTPDDPRYPDQYGPQITNTESAWDTTLGSTAVDLGLLDTGINAGHEDFVDSRVSGWDYVNGDSSIDDAKQCSYHGSHTSGTAAATTNNGVGVAGMSESSIVMHKIFDKGGFGGCGAASTSDIADALADLGDKGAHVSSNSWGGGGADQAILDAIDYAHSKGVIHVAAAGNDGECTDCVSEPWRSRPSKVVIASCTDSSDGWCSFSSQGPEVDLAAPGNNVLSVDGGGGYKEMSGTSMSTPHVGGAVALYIAAHGDVSHSDMETLLAGSADDLGLSSARQGAGRLNAGALVGSSSGPSASFTYSCDDLNCSFDASGSSGDISSYDWEFGDGTTGTGEFVNHTYDAEGTYQVNLTVTNSTGATDTESKNVSVSPNSAPTADFTYSCTDLTCDFDASGSSDSDGSISSYDWEFGDGTTGTGVTVTHTYDAAGNYTVNLTVTDDDGATDTTSKVVSVSNTTGESMHVHGIDHWGTGPHANAEVVIYDSNENPVSGATVTAETCDSNNNCVSWTATTGSDGVVSMKWHHAGSGTYTTCVQDVTHDTLTWDSSQDHADDGSCETETI